MSDVFELMSANTAGPRSKVCVLALCRLDSSLLVDAEYHRSLGGTSVELADAVDLRAELRVGRMKPLLHAMRTYITRLQNALQMAATDLLDNTSLNSPLAQRVQRRQGRAGAIRIARFARQGHQLQPLRLPNLPRTSRPLLFLQARHSQP